MHGGIFLASNMMSVSFLLLMVGVSMQEVKNQNGRMLSEPVELWIKPSVGLWEWMTGAGSTDKVSHVEVCDDTGN